MRRWLNTWYFRLAEGLAMRLPASLHPRICTYCRGISVYLKEQQSDR